MRNFNELVIITLYMFCLILTAGEEDGCIETSCRQSGPRIRFPFRLKSKQPSYCGYPGFDLSCTKYGHTLLELPFAVKLFIKEIDYKNQVIHAYDPDICLCKHLANLNLTASPFNFNSKYLEDYTFFNCTSRESTYFGYEIPCVESPGYQVCAVISSVYINYLPISSCTKMYNILSIPPDLLPENNDLMLHWWAPNCATCEEKRQKCRLKSSSPWLEIECYGHLETKKGITKSQLLAVSVPGSVLFVAVILVIWRLFRASKADREDRVKIEKFLEDYKALKPTRYTYADLKRITNDFKDKLGQGAYGTVFKGKLSQEIIVAVKILNNAKENGEEFINEVGIIGRIHHVNVVRLIGYCADGFRRALVYEFLANESLEKFIFSTDRNKNFLGWEKLLHISLGAAKGIEYLHQGCEQRILHFDIKPHNVLLDHNFNPKISDFGLAKLCAKDQSAVSMTAARGTMGYIAPEVFSRNFGNVSYKSDVYSFGMLLLGMVGGRRNTKEIMENGSEIYYPEWIYNILEQGEELRIWIEEEGDVEIARKLAIVGLWCIQWYPINRPSMKTVIQMLEGGEDLKIPPNPFSSQRSHTNHQIMLRKNRIEQEIGVIFEHT